MHKLPKDLFLRWSMSKFLECLRSWLHKWNTKKFILRKMMSAFTNRKAYQGLPIGEKLKAQIETHRVSRLKTAVQSRTTRKLTLSARWSRMTSIAVVTALTCYTNLSPVAALAPMPTARAIALAMPMLVLNASNDSPELIPNQWDTDSKTVGHDTRASACISDCSSEFVPGTLKPFHRIVKTFGGRLSGGISIGTLRWNVLDGQGQHHTWLIPNSYCIPKAGLKLFSPQHWAQSIGGNANSNTNAKCTIMHWNNGESTLSLTHDRLSNVANFYLAPGYDDFLAFAQEAELTDDTKPVALADIPTVSDDDYSIASDDDHPDTDQEDPWITDWHYELNQEEAPLTEDPADSEGSKPRIFDLTPDDQMTSEHVLRSDAEEVCMQHPNPAI